MFRNKRPLKRKPNNPRSSLRYNDPVAPLTTSLGRYHFVCSNCDSSMLSRNAKKLNEQDSRAMATQGNVKVPIPMCTACTRAHLAVRQHVIEFTDLYESGHQDHDTQHRIQQLMKLLHVKSQGSRGSHMPINRILYVPRKLRFVPRARVAVSSADEEFPDDLPDLSSADEEAPDYTQIFLHAEAPVDTQIFLHHVGLHRARAAAACAEAKLFVQGMVPGLLNSDTDPDLDLDTDDEHPDKLQETTCPDEKRRLRGLMSTHLNLVRRDQLDTDNELADPPRTWFPMMHQQEAKAAQDAGTLPVQGLGTWRMQMRRKAKWVRVSPERERQ
jgi:hypothetical protein